MSFQSVPAVEPTKSCIKARMPRIPNWTDRRSCTADQSFTEFVLKVLTCHIYDDRLRMCCGIACFQYSACVFLIVVTAFTFLVCCLVLKLPVFLWYSFVSLRSCVVPHTGTQSTINQALHLNLLRGPISMIESLSPLIQGAWGSAGAPFSIEGLQYWLRSLRSKAQKCSPREDAS